MRDLILKMSISIDGFVGSPGGGIEWVFDSDQEATAWIVETVWSRAGVEDTHTAVAAKWMGLPVAGTCDEAVERQGHCR